MANRQSQFISIDWKILRAKWMREPETRWHAGLEEGGKAFVANFQPNRYGRPPIYPANSGFYRRTYTLAREVAYQVLYSQDMVEFYAPFYLNYLLDGTGVFGERGVPYTSRGPWPMRFISTGAKMTGQEIIANKIRGTIWETKKEV